jgi:hypothetical protein
MANSALQKLLFREELVTVHTEQRMRAPLFRQWNAGHFQYEYRFEGTHP